MTDGQVVAQNQPLLIMNADRTLSDGRQLRHLLIAEYQAQRDAFSDQLIPIKNTFQFRQLNISQRIATARTDVKILSAQMVTVQSRQAIYTAQLDIFQRLKSQGYASVSELESLQAQMLNVSKKQQELDRNFNIQHNLIRQLETQLKFLPDGENKLLSYTQVILSDLTKKLRSLIAKNHTS